MKLKLFLKQKVQGKLTTIDHKVVPVKSTLDIPKLMGLGLTDEAKEMLQESGEALVKDGNRELHMILTCD